MNDLTRAELHMIDFALSQQIRRSRELLQGLRAQGLTTDANHTAGMIEVMGDARAKIRAIPFPPDPPDDPPAD